MIISGYNRNEFVNPYRKMCLSAKNEQSNGKSPSTVKEVEGAVSEHVIVLIIVCLKWVCFLIFRNFLSKKLWLNHSKFRLRATTIRTALEPWACDVLEFELRFTIHTKKVHWSFSSRRRSVNMKNLNWTGIKWFFIIMLNWFFLFHRKKIKFDFLAAIFIEWVFG